MRLVELVKKMNVMRWSEGREQFDMIDVEDAIKSENIVIANREALTKEEIATLLQWESVTTRNAILASL